MHLFHTPHIRRSVHHNTERPHNDLFHPILRQKKGSKGGKEKKGKEKKEKRGKERKEKKQKLLLFKYDFGIQSKSVLSFKSLPVLCGNLGHKCLKICDKSFVAKKSLG